MEYLKRLLVGSCLLGFSLSVFAIPALQVDIDGGTYVGGTEESTMTSDSEFTVNVYGKDSTTNVTGTDAEKTYYMSVAIFSTDGTIIDASTDFGSFMVGGTTYNWNDLLFGLPPADETYKDINHEPLVKDTLYLELAFQFDVNSLIAGFNVADGNDAENAQMYVQSFDIVKNLTAGFEMHFDAYHLSALCDPLDKSCKEKVDVFAPFSHDGGTYTVPESTSLLLLMVGLLGLVAVKRKA